MGMLRELTIVIFIIICNFRAISGQTAFNGSFKMSFDVAEREKNVPLLWYVEDGKANNQMTFELQDEMIKKGVSKRVLFNPSDSTWTMLIEFNKIKQGSRIHAAAMYRDSIKHTSLIVKSTKEKRIIEGYQCSKIIFESDSSIAEGWVTKDINFDLCNIYRLLSHCGMMNEYIQKGEWYFSDKVKTMILELTSRNKSTGESYTLKITNVTPGNINKKFFNLDGFKISDIPEGLNCGVSIENSK